MAWFTDLATSLAGAATNLFANNRAAGQSSKAIEAAAYAQAIEAEKARAEVRAATGRGIDAIRAGTAGYVDTMAPLMHFNPRGLTASQEIALEDIGRDADATLAASGLRGAGRAGVAARNDTMRRAISGFYDDNRAYATGLRQGLANIYADEGRAVANTEIGAGSQLAGSYANQGAVNANAIRSIGDVRAGATTANASTINDTFGAIGAVIADEIKNDRTNRYATRRMDQV